MTLGEKLAKAFAMCRQFRYSSVRYEEGLKDGRHYGGKCKYSRGVKDWVQHYMDYSVSHK